MSAERELIFVESRGRPPRPETLAAKLLHACSVDDEDIWDSLGIREMDERELEEAVAQLRRLGWDFFYGVRQ
jgi:hypothetical protein